MHADRVDDSENYGTQYEHPDDEPSGAAASFEDVRHRIRSAVEDRKDPMRGGRDQFRHSPYGPTHDDLEDEHIQHDTTRRQPENGCDGNEQDDPCQGVMNAEKLHVPRCFA